ncbi:MAG: transglycosylase domain-containing protein [Actinomycetota bacterium]
MPPFFRRAAPSALALLALVAAACAQFADLPTLRPEDLTRIKLAQSSFIYDDDGNLITTMHGIENRTVVPLRRIPEHVRDAVIAIEDARFYDHEGVDLKAVVRALVANATSGEIKEGGSTITQQLVKNTIIAPEGQAARTIERKIREAALSRQLETRVSKDWILEKYMNTVYFGEGAYGIQAAAKTYFGKPVGRLDMGQAALLAGLIRSPEQYNPLKNRDAGRARRDTVLERMVANDFVTESEAEQAMTRGLRLDPAEDEDRYSAPHFVDYVQRLIKYDPRFEAVGGSVDQREKRMFQGGLRIYTTVDLATQAAAEEAVVKVLPYESDPYASVVAIEPSTGHVKAMVGGRDWFAGKRNDRYSKLNLAILNEPDAGRVLDPVTGKYEKRAPGTGRQSGSAFKPFVLAAAIEDGIPLSKSYKGGSQIVFPGLNNGTDYVVHNYEGSSYGNMSLLEGTVNSVNVVYAQVIEEVGAQDVVDTAAAMGISGYDPLDPYLSAALGSNEVNPLDMASGFGTFATNGVYNPPVAITRIVNSAGKTIYEVDDEPGEQVIEATTAYLTTTALEQVILRGTGTGAQIGRPAAGKTGTAQEYRDAWFVGYTPDLVASVWVGYPGGQIEMKPSCAVTFVGEREVCRPTRTTTSLGVTGGSFPASIWQLFMLEALSGVPADPFPVPSGGFVTVTIDTRNNCLAGRFTPERFRASATYAVGSEPDEECRVKDKDLISVPDVFGFPAREATSILQDAGFEVVQQPEASTTYPPGRVIGQDPSGGSKAPPGSTVVIAVSAHGDVDDDDDDGLVTVPSVLGMIRGAAEAEIRNAGLVPRTIIESDPNRGRARRNNNRVWKQSPSSGSEARAGSTVTIWVNQG